MTAQRRSGARFFGARAPGLEGPVGPALRTVAPRRPVVLPRSVRRDIAALGTASRRASEGDRRPAADSVERLLLQRISFGPNLAEEQRIEEVGYARYLDEQLDFETLDDSELEDALRAALPTLGLKAADLFGQYETRPFAPVFELWSATLLRALYSPRQLFERMVELWTDHFNIDISGDQQPLLKPVDDRTVIRAHALGTFPELLSASAHSPAMLVYLTNDSNHKDFPNENYARELMELHTLGADNGYTESDVKEVARCFTGWTWYGPRSSVGETGTFQFSSFSHDRGNKQVLGRTIAEGGIGDGERVLAILGNHANTSEFIATKILRHFWGYEPATRDVRKVAAVYRRSGGNIRSMLRTALRAARLAPAPRKLKRPFHLAVSALRALGADLQRPGPLLERLELAGQLPFNWSPPDGYPDEAEYWAGFIMPRWNLAAAAMQIGEFGMTLAPGLDDPDEDAAAIGDRLDRVLLGGAMLTTTREQVLEFLAGRPITRQRVRDAIGLVIASPEFQEY